MVLLATVLGGTALCFGAALFFWMRIYIPQARHDAEARWAAIGRPMEAFGKYIEPFEENESLRALVRDLRPFGVATFYKASEGVNDPNTLSVPNDIGDWIDSSKLRFADQTGTAMSRCMYLEGHADDLNHLYQGILQREPPVWKFVPRDGMRLRVPNYQVARKLAQLILVDALRKSEQGDEKGASDAIAAALKMTSNIDDQRILVSQMIGTAIQALLAEAVVRLPEDPHALQCFPVEVEARRERLRTALQCETWAVMNLTDYLGMEPDHFEDAYRTASTPRKFLISLQHSFLERDCNRFISCGAQQVAITERVRDNALSDMGTGEMRQRASRIAPVSARIHRLAFFAEAFCLKWDRAWKRLNLALLLGEQAEIIRSARSQVHAGKSGSLGELDSVVIPGAKWRVIGDAAGNSVSLTLTPIPAWTVDGEIIGDDFFLLPLDGSQSWKFRLPAQSRAPVPAPVP